jgi:hypothetical protein
MDGSRLVNKDVRDDEALTILLSTGKLKEIRRKKRPQKGT